MGNTRAMISEAKGDRSIITHSFIPSPKSEQTDRQRRISLSMEVRDIFPPYNFIPPSTAYVLGN